MLKHLVQYFLNRHLLSNALFILVFLGGIFSYHTIKKEEFPDITFRTMRIQTTYPGASSQDVERDITIPIEERIQNLSGIRQITSTTSQGLSSIQLELDRDANVLDVKTEVSDAVSRVPMPDDVLDDPRVSLFNISRKAILDIGITLTDITSLSLNDRLRLQQVARQLKAFLLRNSAFSDVNFTGYLSEEMNINIDPLAINAHRLSLNNVITTLQDANRQQPVGETYTNQWIPVRLSQSLTDPDQLRGIKLNRSFGASDVLLNDIATVTMNVARQTSAIRVNGSDAILLELIKSPDVDLLTAIDIAKQELDRFNSIYLNDQSVAITLFDDESMTLRNRLSMIATNGVIGFVLIVLALIVFLNRQAALWVAMGLPFCVAFTLIMGLIFDFTINGITLSAIIIVLGIVVDDAIIIAEHIYRCYFEGRSMKDAAILGVQDMMLPVIAGVTTTCMAFVPLLMFDNRFGDFVKPIPLVIFLMLGASLLESFFILPGHLTLSPPKRQQPRTWIVSFEHRYARFISRLITVRWGILLGFVVLMGLTIWLGTSRIKFVMFPHDESREIVITGNIKGSTSIQETATALRDVDSIIPNVLGDDFLGAITTIARQRMGGRQSVNSFRITIEIPEANDRSISANEYIETLKSQLSSIDRLEKLMFRKARWGSRSGSAIEINVQSNNDTDRMRAISMLQSTLSKQPNIESVDIKKAFVQPVIEIALNQSDLQRLGVSPAAIGTALKTAMGGVTVFDIQRTDDPIEYKLRYHNFQHRPLDDILTLTIPNAQGYLVPLSELVELTTIEKPIDIQRRGGYRISTIFADLTPTSNQTPLEFANDMETSIFPTIISAIPGVLLSFDGEVVDSREGQRDVAFSFLFTIFGIYLILALLFQSLVRPFRILFILPFGIMSVALVFLLIGKSTIGFFGVIGLLGMLGVVVNDAIVLYVRLDRFGGTPSEIATVSSTRLRAICLTTITTVAGVMPTAYGIGGFDAMLSEMMLSLGWGLVGGMFITLILVPMAYACESDIRQKLQQWRRQLPLGLVMIGYFLMPAHISATQLTESDFVLRAITNNPSFELILASSIADQHALDLSVNVSDIVTSVVASNLWDVNDHTTIPNTSMGIANRIYPTGSTLGFNYQHRRYPGSAIKVEQYGATFSQDLLRNAFGSNHRLSLKNHKLQEQIITLQAKESMEDYLAALRRSYIDWAGAEQRLFLEIDTLKNLNVLLNDIRERRQRTIASDNDVRRVQVQVLDQQRRVLDAEYALEHTWAHVSQLINDANTLTPVIQPPSAIDLRIPTQNRSITALMLVDDINRHEQKIRANERFPSISLDVSVLKETRYMGTQSSKSTFGSAGLGIDLSLRNASNKRARRLANSNKKTSFYQLQSERQKYIQSTNQLASHLRVLIKQHAIESKKQALSKAMLTQDALDFKRGALSLKDYIDSMNRSIQSKHAELNGTLAWHYARIEWLRFTDQLTKN